MIVYLETRMVKRKSVVVEIPEGVDVKIIIKKKTTQTNTFWCDICQKPYDKVLSMLQCKKKCGEARSPDACINEVPTGTRTRPYDERDGPTWKKQEEERLRLYYINASTQMMWDSSTETWVIDPVASSIAAEKALSTCRATSPLFK